MFDFFHDEGALDGGDIVVAADDVQQELLVVAHVGRLDAEQIVKASGDVVALGDLGDAAHQRSEGLCPFDAELAQLDAAENCEASVQLRRVKDCGVLLDVTEAFQTLHALISRSGGQMYLRSQLFIGETGVLLEGTEDVEVLGVEGIFFF